MNLEQTAEKLSREQIIAKLKQKNLQGGNGHACPPPFN